MLSLGWHSGAVFGPSAAAASVSKLLGFTPNLIEDAIGMACTQTCGLMSAQFERIVKRMQHGFAAQNGLFAALMAKEGYIGIKQVLERQYGGFLSTFGQGSGKDPLYRPDEVVKSMVVGRPQATIDRHGGPDELCLCRVVQLIDSQVLLAQCRHEELGRDLVWEVMGKTVCRQTDDLDNPWAQRVTIDFNNRKPSLWYRWCKLPRELNLPCRMVISFRNGD